MNKNGSKLTTEEIRLEHSRTRSFLKKVSTGDISAPLRKTPLMLASFVWLATVIYVLYAIEFELKWNITYSLFFYLFIASAIRLSMSWYRILKQRKQ